MGEKIALGFHTCVDFEMTWNTQILERMIREFGVRSDEIQSGDIPIDSERALLISSLWHLKRGLGCELVPDTNQICLDFANRFQYRVTIGGTATRAAIAISKIGYESTIQLCCFNKYMKELLPKEIHYMVGAKQPQEEIYPHVILSYQGGVHICANDIDFTTPRENRVMFSRDIDSMYMEISPDYESMIQDAEVFLLSCFSEILEEDVLEDRMNRTRNLLQTLPMNTITIMEDGCYIRKDFRRYVHQALREVVDVLSMNEEELQEYIQRRIDILNADEVLEAVEEVHEKVQIPILLVHSGAWALTYGKGARMYKRALEGGITMAASRFRYGDDFGRKEYEETGGLEVQKKSVIFSEKIEKKAGEVICCIPCKDLSFVKNPTVVGLGDFFAGGLLPRLTAEQRIEDGNK